jgi:dienelactone hydrolase
VKKVGIGVLIILGLGLLIGLNYALFAGKILGLTPEVRAALRSDSVVKVALLEDDSWLVMIPGRTAPTTGLILYPEGHMDIRSYALIGREVARQGFQVVFLSRRLETEYSEAEELRRIEAAMAAYPQIERWAVGGHTWGGRVGVDYAANHPDRVAGVVLWAGRMDGSTSLAGSDLPVLMVYGTLDDENVNLVASARPRLPEHTVWVAIEGGNRAQFANFGPMPADATATISSESQQAQAAAATIEFLGGLSE